MSKYICAQENIIVSKFKYNFIHSGMCRRYFKMIIDKGIHIEKNFQKTKLLTVELVMTDKFKNNLILIS